MMFLWRNYLKKTFTYKKQFCVDCNKEKTINKAPRCNSCGRKNSKYKTIISNEQKITISNGHKEANEIIKDPILSFNEIQLILKEINILDFRDSRKNRTFYKKYPIIFKHINYYTSDYKSSFFSKLVAIKEQLPKCFCGNSSNWNNKNSKFENSNSCCSKIFYKNTSKLHLMIKNGPIKGFIMNYDSKIKNSKGQRSLKWYIDKYGPKSGTIKYNESYKKIMNNRKTAMYSKISQKLFKSINYHISLPEAKKGKLQYATNGYGEHRINFNKKEKKLIGESKVTMFVDFKFYDKVIEFDGSYWHQNKEYDEIRDKILIKRGYKVLRINEKDYKNLVVEKWKNV